MNKYLIILIILALIIGGSIAIKNFTGMDDNALKVTGVVREVTIRAVKNEWRFDPDLIEVNHGDTVKLTIINEDDFDHGIQIDAYGVSKRIPAKGKVEAHFIASITGEFPFFCSVPCGSGVVNGVQRGHLDQKGRIVVKSLVKPL